MSRKVLLLSFRPNITQNTIKLILEMSSSVQSLGFFHFEALPSVKMHLISAFLSNKNEVLKNNRARNRFLRFRTLHLLSAQQRKKNSRL